MKFNFKIQQYQTDAVDSVVGVFKGQPYVDPINYRRYFGKVKSAVSYSQMSLTQLMKTEDVLNTYLEIDFAVKGKIPTDKKAYYPRFFERNVI